MPSENDVESSTSPDRRTRKREARRAHLLDLAADLVGEVGVEGVTMAALAEAGDYATASLYTYFPSRSALLAALQQKALATLGAVAEAHLAVWDDALAASSGRRAATDAALTRLLAFSDLFLAAPHRHPREFRLQQQMLVTAGAQETADAATVVPAAMAVLDVPRRLLGDAARAGALAPAPAAADPLDDPLDGDLVRTLAWISALNGALLVDGLTTGIPVTGTDLGHQLTTALLLGWGADAGALEQARAHADLLPSPTTLPGALR